MARPTSRQGRPLPAAALAALLPPSPLEAHPGRGGPALAARRRLLLAPQACEGRPQEQRLAPRLTLRATLSRSRQPANVAGEWGGTSALEGQREHTHSVRARLFPHPPTSGIGGRRGEAMRPGLPHTLLPSSSSSSPCTEAAAQGGGEAHERASVASGGCWAMPPPLQPPTPPSSPGGGACAARQQSPPSAPLGVAAAAAGRARLQALRRAQPLRGWLAAAAGMQQPALAGRAGTGRVGLRLRQAAAVTPAHSAASSLRQPAHWATGSAGRADRPRRQLVPREADWLSPQAGAAR